MHAGDSAVFAAILLLLMALAWGARRLARRTPSRRLPERAAPPVAPATVEPQPAAEEPATELAARSEVAPAIEAAPIPEPSGEALPPDPAEGERQASRPPAPLVVWVERPLVRVEPPRRRPTRHPILLAHGFAGFDSLGIRGHRLAYFRGVEERLRAADVQVHVLRVSPVAPIAQRARELADQVRRFPAERVNIVAHSMGGLDARYALTRLGLSERVASLITIGTPHHGTPLADLGVSLLGGPLGRLGVPLDAFRDLTTERMEAFNLEAGDAPGVVYGCFVASAREVHALLVPAHRFLHRRAGDNDGIVPASSQRWGEVLGEIDADHWGSVGWSSRFDAGAFYERLAHDLGARGL